MRDIQEKIGQLQKLSDQVQASEKDILEKAIALLDKINADLPEARTKSLTGGSDEYMKLIKQKGDLMQIVSRSRMALR